MLKRWRETRVAWTLVGGVLALAIAGCTASGPTPDSVPASTLATAEASTEPSAGVASSEEAGVGASPDPGSAGAVAIGCPDISVGPSVLMTGFECVEDASLLNFDPCPGPIFLRVTLEGYPTGAYAAVYLYPIEDFAAAGYPPWNDADAAIESLRALVSASSDGPWGAWDGTVSPPFMTYCISAEQTFFSHVLVRPWGAGEGVRYLTLWSQELLWIEGAEILTYTYQGVTADGRYWIDAQLPITPTTIAPAAPHDGWEYDEYAAWASSIQDHYDSEPSTAFSPTLDALDALMLSFSIGG